MDSSEEGASIPQGDSKPWNCFQRRSVWKHCGYSDADQAGDLEDRKSTSGYLFQIVGGPISWRSKKQDTVVLSTAEAEYVALRCPRNCLALRRLILELNNPPDGPTTILEDNQSAMAMAKNPQFHGRAKHIDLRHHFIREHVDDGEVKLMYCPTQEMMADILTKEITQQQFCNLRQRAGMESSTQVTVYMSEEEC